MRETLSNKWLEWSKKNLSIAVVLNRIRAFPEKINEHWRKFFNVPRNKTRSKTRPRFQVARVVVHTHIDIDTHIRVYVKFHFHFHLHLQSYLSNWHIIYVVNYIRSNINVQHVLFAHVRTAAKAGPDQPEPSSSPARASRPKRSVPHSCPAKADATSHWRRL